MKSVAVSSAARGAGGGWSWRWLEAAPHRLAFFLAMVVLCGSGLWWATIQLDRVVGIGLPYDLSPSVVHSALMTFGFMPLFFSGFLFTAGPKWLGVQAPTVRRVRTPLLLMALGWLVWPVAGHFSATAAAAALLPAFAGLSLVTLRFWRLVRASAAPDRIHAKCIGVALVVGCVCIAGVAAGVLADNGDLARTFVHTALWGFVAAVYVTVAHRMIPFFTSSALPMVRAWRPFWVLYVLVGVVAFEAAAAWVELATEAPAWFALRGAVELCAGAVTLWLCVAWGLVQSLKVRLVAMLHIGFCWLGIGLALSGVSHLAQARTGAEWLPLAGLHAFTMGCLGSLMVAMVTRVTCGHSGRALVADNFVWTLFWLLQGATLLRIAAAAPLDAAPEFTLAAAASWAGVLTAWALRYGAWYGRPRPDGRPG
ncbi:MAG TPA: NnrS family protein [Ramlibacter sp.]|jgi:uncharacterized protein involved in response to NO